MSNRRSRSVPSDPAIASILQLQRSLGNGRLARRLSAGRVTTPTISHHGLPLAAVQRDFNQGAEVRTDGGSWKAEIYREANEEAKHLRGVDIHLVFTPGPGVDADTIGLTQTISSLREGEPHYVTGTGDRRGLAKERAETVAEGDRRGLKIDRGRTTKTAAVGQGRQMETQHTNPIYGADVPFDEHSLEQTTVDSEQQERGGRNALGSATPGGLRTAAELYDEPRHLEPLGTNSEQRFETTALALSGVDKDTYYGSVEWGWRTDGDGQFGGITFAVKEHGGPSDAFKEAGRAWNTSASMRNPAPFDDAPRRGRANLQLPGMDE